MHGADRGPGHQQAVPRVPCSRQNAPFNPWQRPCILQPSTRGLGREEPQRAIIRTHCNVLFAICRMRGPPSWCWSQAAMVWYISRSHSTLQDVSDNTGYLQTSCEESIKSSWPVTRHTSCLFQSSKPSATIVLGCAARHQTAPPKESLLAVAVQVCGSHSVSSPLSPPDSSLGGCAWSALSHAKQDMLEESLPLDACIQISWFWHRQIPWRLCLHKNPAGVIAKLCAQAQLVRWPQAVGS